MHIEKKFMERCLERWEQGKVQGEVGAEGCKMRCQSTIPECVQGGVRAESTCRSGASRSGTGVSAKGGQCLQKCV